VRNVVDHPLIEGPLVSGSAVIVVSFTLNHNWSSRNRDGGRELIVELDLRRPSTRPP